MADEHRMTDEQLGRAEAEVAAEAAIDDGRGEFGPGEPTERDLALVLAGLHLRLGSLSLARAELETLAGRGVLDAPARVDLAEARWRTGDLSGGGEAAREALAGGREAVVALVVAAEAASALGRPSEARRLAGRALDLNVGPIDPVFSGMPRSSVWPSDPAEPAPSAATLFPPERTDALVGAAHHGATLTAADDRELAAAAEAADIAEAADAAVAPGEPGLWDLEGTIATDAVGPTGPNELEPSALLDAGRADLASGDRAAAAVHLGLVVRLAPALAPAVLSVIGEATDAGLHLVQGDAYRAVGHESEARRAYAAAMTAAAASSAEHRAEAEAAAAPHAAPAETALWWLEPPAEPEPGSPDERRYEQPAEPETEQSAEPEAEPSAELDQPWEPGFEPPAEPEIFEPPTEPEFVPEPGTEPESPGETPAEPGPPTEASEPPEPERLQDEGERHDGQGGWHDDA